MKAKIFFALNSEIHINTHFKNIWTNYIRSDVLTKRSVLLPVDWNKTGLLFTKRLHIMSTSGVPDFVGNEWVLDEYYFSQVTHITNAYEIIIH